MRAVRAAAVATGICTLLAAACADGDRTGEEDLTADLILTGGLVWSGPGTPASGPDAPTALAVREGRVQAVGSDADVAALAGPETERIELAGRRVVPGFLDNHTHFIEGGFELASVQLRDAASPAELARRIGEFAREHPGEWVTGGLWDHENWGGELPRRAWIDSLTRETPVFVQRLDGHMGLANTLALERVGVTAETPDPPGGQIVRDEDGRPTGILRDAAQRLVRDAIPPPTDAELDRALEAALEHALSRGVTLVTDMGTFHGWRGLETYRRARAAGRLPLRVYAAVPLADWERMAAYVAEGGRGDDRLRWGAVKGFVDGSLGSSTAWFHQPYADDPASTGLVVTDTAVLRERILAADSAGLHLFVHAIGTQANDWLLDAFAASAAANGPRDRRFRVEHAQYLTPEAIRRFADDGLVASMQPYHAIDDGRWAERKIGPERAKTTYAFRDLLDAGAHVTFGSDWTVAPIDPLLGVYAAVTRRTTDGKHPDGWVREQKITVEEALAAYTTANAWASYLEDRVGRLEPGHDADLVVLSEDIFAIPPKAIETVEAELTMVEGEVAWEAEGGSGPGMVDSM